VMEAPKAPEAVPEAPKAASASSYQRSPLAFRGIVFRR
jgi:hypothetical protein